MENPTLLSPEFLPGLGRLIRTLSGTTVLGMLGGVAGGPPAGEEFTHDFLVKEYESGRLEALGFPGRDRVTGALLWKRLSWDSDILGRECARLFLVGGEGRKRLFEFWKERAASLGIQYATMRIPESVFGRGAGPGSERETELESLSALLEEEGFENIERLIFLKRSTSAPDPRHHVGESNRNEIEDIMSIAALSYTFDRFHSEPLFSKEEADRVHMAWARDSFSRPSGRVLSVRDSGGEIVGYIVCLELLVAGSRHGWIDMLAVRERNRRRGFGESLVLAALRHFHGAGLEICALSTQEQNLPALGLYKKLGFTRYGAASTYRLVL